MSINAIEALQAIGLHPVVIDENTDFDNLGNTPWKSEPNQLKWTDSVTGYKCAIRRTELGCLCGYVRVPCNHPWHNKKYFGKNRQSHARDGVRPDSLINVHGGITFSGKPSRETGGKFRGHWFGFDCAHYMDIVPELVRLAGKNGWSIFEGNTYKDIAFVKTECADMARQLKKWEKS